MQCSHRSKSGVELDSCNSIVQRTNANRLTWTLAAVTQVPSCFGFSSGIAPVDLYPTGFLSDLFLSVHHEYHEYHESKHRKFLCSMQGQAVTPAILAQANSQMYSLEAFRALPCSPQQCPPPAVGRMGHI